jgi:diadenylate cyclase
MLHIPSTLRWQDVIDIIIVSYIIYRIILLLRGTGAAQIVVGIIFLSVLYFLAGAFDLLTLHWLLRAFLSSLLLIIIIVFQRDIRRVLLQVGKAPFHTTGKVEAQDLEEIVAAVQYLAKRRIGALFAVEQEAGLLDIIEGGTAVDASLHRAVLISFFLPASPLHDGCTVIKEGRVHSAGCLLPLSHNQSIPKRYGTRHRAALGLSEESDAVVLVVSEETQAISLVHRGAITPMANEELLYSTLKNLLLPHEPNQNAWRSWRSWLSRITSQEG